MVKIIKIKLLQNYLIHFFFSDNTDKVIDLSKFIKENSINEVLKNKDYFAKVKLYDNGRGIYWPNGFDLCPDTLRYFTEAVKELA
ncbi:MAG: DUF2442 domain-containing protein [Ignavibacteria bacterium]|nr:DUF2442 domain-containing protein [Ignavibacteria bacterium]